MAPKLKAAIAPTAPAKAGRPSARAKLLEAALALILEGGAEALTYDSLAQKSGLSKGGILYHFPSREAMNKAIREHVRQQYRAARRAATEALPETPSRALKGWAISSLHNRSGLDAVSARIMSSGLWDSAEGAAHHRERFAAISKGVGFDRAAVVYLATEGLWFLELAGFLPFSRKDRKRVVMKLLSLADGGEIDGALVTGS